MTRDIDCRLSHHFIFRLINVWGLCRIKILWRDILNMTVNHVNFICLETVLFWEMIYFYIDMLQRLIRNITFHCYKISYWSFSLQWWKFDIQVQVMRMTSQKHTSGLFFLLNSQQLSYLRKNKHMKNLLRIGNKFWVLEHFFGQTSNPLASKFTQFRETFDLPTLHPFRKIWDFNLAKNQNWERREKQKWTPFCFMKWHMA